MKNIIKHNKKFIFFVLFILFTFILNTNTSLARTISFSIHSGRITTIKDESDSDDKDEDINQDNDENDKTDEDEDIVDKEQIVKNGAYIISCASNDKFVFDISGPSTDNGANLHVWQRTEAPNQKFYISYEGEGYYKIASINSAKMIDINEASKESGANAQQYENNDTDAQRFKIIENSDNTYSFIAKCSGMALDVEGAVFENGTNIRQYDINGTNAQKFRLEETELINENINNGIISIKSAKNPNMQLDVKDSLPDEGNIIHLWEKSATLAQRFEVHRVGENEVRIKTVTSGGWIKESNKKIGSDIIQSGDSNTKPTNSDTWKIKWNEGIILVNKESGLALNIDGNIDNNGTKITVEDISNADTQKFLINTEYLIPEGWYEISSPLGTTMDLDNSGSDWGTNIHMWTKNNQNNQKFYIKYTDNGYKITTMYGLALDVENASLENNANVRQWEDNGSNCQRWVAKIIDGGYLKFKNVNSNKYLDVANASKESGANVQQYEENETEAQLWKLIPTRCTSGWFSSNGSLYCYDPITGQLVTNCTRVDPMLQNPNDYGAIYDFDSQGRATWHLPTQADLPGGTGPSAPIPNLTGDRRQRVLLLALSRLGCPYQRGNAPTGFVCDGLTAWCYTTALGDWFYTGEGAREDLQDASWQWEKIENRNGIKYDQNQLKPGDLVFFGNPQVAQGPGMIDYNGAAYHAGIYYKDGIMINATSSGGICFYSVSDYYMDWLGGGSPYEAETSRVEIPH